MERLYNLLKFRHPGCEVARTESRYLLSKREVRQQGKWIGAGDGGGIGGAWEGSLERREEMGLGRQEAGQPED